MSKSIDPELYALVHQGNEGDLQLYLRACEGAARVLELGSGFGRVSLALAEEGCEVWGVELDPGLLSLAETHRTQRAPEVAARVHFVLGDMRAPPVQGTFDRVIVPFSGLYCLTDEDDLLGCLRAARALLAPDGLLIFDGYAADGFHTECEPDDLSDDHLEPVALIAAHGVAYDVFERSCWDKQAQRLVATYVYRPDGGGEAIEHAIEQRYLLSAQVSALLARAGFSASELRGSFDGAPYDADSDVMVVVAHA